MLIPLKNYKRIGAENAKTAGFICLGCQKSNEHYSGNRASRKGYTEFGVHEYFGQLMCDKHYYELFE